MGEAVKKVSAKTREAHPEVPWKDIAGMRDRVVHDYFGVSLDEDELPLPEPSAEGGARRLTFGS